MTSVQFYSNPYHCVDTKYKYLQNQPHKIIPPQKTSAINQYRCFFVVQKVTEINSLFYKVHVKFVLKHLKDSKDVVVQQARTFKINLTSHTDTIRVNVL